MTPAPPPLSRWIHPDRLDLVLVAGSLIVIAGLALTWGSEGLWIGHAMAGIFGFVLLILTLLAGAAMAGRTQVFARDRAFGIHRAASVGFIIYTAGTFFLGLYSMYRVGEPLLETRHGILGLAILLLALVQLVPYHLVHRKELHILHRLSGYAILPLFILQRVMGFAISELFEVS